MLMPAAIVTLIFLTSCGGGGSNGSDATPNEDRIQAMTTLPLFADFVREIRRGSRGGISLIPNSRQSGRLAARRGRCRTHGGADIAFANGHDYEPAAASCFRKISGRALHL